MLLFFCLKFSNNNWYEYFWCFSIRIESIAIFFTNSLNFKSSSKLILNGAVLINIPGVFFSLKLVLFKIGVPITNSSKLEISPIYIA